MEFKNIIPTNQNVVPSNLNHVHLFFLKIEKIKLTLTGLTKILKKVSKIAIF
jgi:hypothetical protein